MFGGVVQVYIPNLSKWLEKTKKSRDSLASIFRPITACLFAKTDITDSDVKDSWRPRLPRAYQTMAPSKPLTMLVARSRPSASMLKTSHNFPPSQLTPLAAFSTSGLRAYATPSGPPPQGFRLPKPERWDQSKESTLDKAGKYFLLTEMARGMYVVLEQYFRPP